MSFQIGDQVVGPTCGVGRITALVTRADQPNQACQYYEVSGDRTTTWVPVQTAAAQGLRLVTHLAQLTGLRAVLRAQPAALPPDYRQRLLEVRARLRGGTLRALCEVVRDLTGRGWGKPLGASDLKSLQLTADVLHREWAAAAGISLAAATAEINTLLLDGRRASQN